MKLYKLKIAYDTSSYINSQNTIAIPNRTSELINDSGFKTVDNYPSRSYSSGLQISSYVGSSVCALYVPYANDTTQAGAVSTAAQTFGGAKTFSSQITSPLGITGTDSATNYFFNLVGDTLTLTQSANYIYTTYKCGSIIYKNPGGTATLSLPTTSGTLGLAIPIVDLRSV